MSDQEPPSGCLARHTFLAHHPITTWAWYQKGASVALASEQGVRFWSLADERPTHAFLLPQPAAHLLFAANDKYLIAASAHEHHIGVWDVQMTMPWVMLYGHHAPISAMTLTHDHKRLISAGKDGFLKVWGLDTGIKQTTLVGHLGEVTSLVVTPDDRWVFSGGQDKTIRGWDLNQGTEIMRLRDQRGQVLALAMSADGRTLLSATDDCTIRCWDVATGALLRILEGHTAAITDLSLSAQDALLASRSEEGEVRLWRCDTWEQVGLLASVGKRSTATPQMAFHPQAPLLATLGTDALHTWDMDYRTLFDDKRGTPSVKYASAKIALVGDAGVGKTGLGYRLAHQDFHEPPSTHGQQFWILDALSKGVDENGVERETILWDFAGQEEYRLVHSLFLDHIDVALLVFDAANHSEPMRGVEYWLHQLAQKDIPKILVSTKVDISYPRMGDHEINGFCDYYGVNGGYVHTSAKKGTGVDRLLQRLEEHLDWSKLTTTVTTATFRRIKSFVLNLKADPLYGKIVVKPPELRKLLKSYDADLKFSQAEMLTAVRLLEQHGYVMVLPGVGARETILLQPNLLINLASSLVLAARDNPRGLGALDEAKLVKGDYDFPEYDGLQKKDIQLLRAAAVELLIEHHLCFRQVLDDRSWLVFPSLIRQKRAYHKDLETMAGNCYRVRGGGERVYAALVVQLGYLWESKRMHCWHHQAQFQVGQGEICGFRLLEVGEGTVDLEVYFSRTASPFTQRDFYMLFERVLDAFSSPWVRYPPVTCGVCHTRQDSRVVVERMDAAKEYMYCAECGQQLALEPDKPLQLDRKERLELDGQAYLCTAFEMMLHKLKSLVQGQEKVPTCFISYAWGDDQHERWVARLAEYLKKADIQVVYDKWHDPLYGDSLARFISLVQPSDFVLPVGTLHYRQKYENKVNPQGSIVAAEVDLINLRLTGTEEQKRTVIPLLLDGEPQKVLPELMQARVMIDFRQERFYFANLFKLIYTLYGLSSTDEDIQQLNTFITHAARAVQ